MKYFSLLVFVLGLFAWSCSLNSELDDPALSVNVDNINMCAKEVGVPYTWQNLQLRNSGGDALVVSNIELRGDTTCSFECFREPSDSQSAAGEYPCREEDENSGGFQMTIWPGETRLVRIVYTASGDGTVDRASLVITSNAPDLGKEGQIIIPMCGVGVAGEVLDDYADCQDAGLADASCETAPSIDCPLCGEILPDTTPGCGNN